MIIWRKKAVSREEVEIQFASGGVRAAWQGVKSAAPINPFSCEARQLNAVNGVDDADPLSSFNSFLSCLGLISQVPFPC